MDFTYIFAAVIAFFVGLLAHMVRLVLHKQWTRLSAAISFGAALVANGLLLLNWPHLLDWGWRFAVLDLSIITVATIIGFGAIAPTALIRIVRQ